MHSKAKQTHVSDLGAETGLLQGQARRMGGLGVGSRDRSVEEPSKENGWLVLKAQTP